MNDSSLSNFSLKIINGMDDSYRNPVENLDVSDVSLGLPEPRVFTDFREEITLEKVVDNSFKVPDLQKVKEFTDAFKDPSCFQYLENIQTSVSTESIPRSSLCVEFDPLYSKRVLMSQIQSTPVAIISEAEGDQSISTPVKKHQVDASIRESSLYIEFDPLYSKRVLIMSPMQSTPFAIISEAESDQNISTHFKKYQVDASIRESLSVLISFDSSKHSSKAEDLQSIPEIHDLIMRMEIFAEVLQSFNCMLKVYEENEVHLKNRISDLKRKYNTLQEHSRDALQKANLEAINAKKSSEVQVTVLKAQLKKAELKISSLKTELSRVKFENSILEEICDDLMAKISEG